jgi:hypothetical protein
MDRQERLARRMFETAMADFGRPNDKWEGTTDRERDLYRKFAGVALKVSGETAWMKFDIVFKDRITGEIRVQENASVEVVTAERGELLAEFPDGPHRMIPIANILQMATPSESGETQ